MTCCELCDKQQALVKHQAFSKEMAMWNMCSKRAPIVIEVVKFQIQELIDYNEKYFFIADCFCGEVRSLRRGTSWASSSSDSLSEAAARACSEKPASWVGIDDFWDDEQDRVVAQTFVDRWQVVRSFVILFLVLIKPAGLKLLRPTFQQLLL